MTVYTFHPIEIWARKSGKCSHCGKQAVRKMKFWASLNPFNKNADGTVKTSDEIRAGLMVKREEWLAKPLLHVKCANLILKSPPSAE